MPSDSVATSGRSSRGPDGDSKSTGPDVEHRRLRYQGVGSKSVGSDVGKPQLREQNVNSRLSGHVVEKPKR